MLQVNTPDMKHHSLFTKGNNTWFLSFLRSHLSSKPRQQIKQPASKYHFCGFIQGFITRLYEEIEQCRWSQGQGVCMCVCVCVGGLIIVVFHPDFQSNNYHPDITVRADWA